MSNIRLIHGSCADQTADVIVNAANNRLAEGGGICGVIFGKAGSHELAEACRKYTVPLEDGSAVMTPSFGLKNAKAIVHAVGPNFGVTPDAFDALMNAYYNSMVVTMENGYNSISFPLISSSIFGGNLENPVGVSVEQCLRAYREFTKNYSNYDIDVLLCAYGEDEYRKAKVVFDNVY